MLDSSTKKLLSAVFFLDQSSRNPQNQLQQVQFCILWPFRTITEDAGSRTQKGRSQFLMSGFMKTVSKTACTKIAGMFLGNRSDSVHKYGHVVLRVLSTLCTLNRSYTIPMQAFEILANESNEPNKAKLELKLMI